MICRNYQQLSGGKNVVFCQFDDFFHAFWKVVSGFRKFINFWKDSSSLFPFSRTSDKFSQLSKVVKLTKYDWFTSARCNFTYYFSISQFKRKSFVYYTWLFPGIFASFQVFNKNHKIEDFRLPFRNVFTIFHKFNFKLEFSEFSRLFFTDSQLSC